MGYFTGESREQYRCFSLEDCLPEESIVRVIDRFVEAQDLSKFLLNLDVHPILLTPSQSCMFTAIKTEFVPPESSNGNPA